MKKEKGLNKLKLQEKVKKIKSKRQKNGSKEKQQERKIVKVKEIVKQRKVKIATIIIAIIAICTAAIYQVKTSKNVQSATNPKLAKAMTYPEVKEGEEDVEGTENVKFDAFFLRDINGDGYAESIRGTSKEIGSEDTLYMEINVQTAGYLKDAKITVNEGGNFYLQTTLPKDQELQDNI